MAERYLLAIDQGTTGTTVLVVDISTHDRALIIGRKTVDFPQYYPQTGWVEHDLDEVWGSVRNATKGAIEAARQNQSSFREKDIGAIGITNQRETLCVMEQSTGRPVRRAIVWQCKRSASICQRLKDEGLEAEFRRKTGLLLDPYFSGTKITWIMENDPATAALVKSGRAVFGTIDTYLVSRLTAGAAFVTEGSNASRTLALDIASGTWDPELIEALGAPGVEAFPEVRNSAGEFGKTRGLDFLPDGIPICGILGDQQAAMAGQTCFEVGEAKCTYGTGAFLLVNLGSEMLTSSHGLLTTILWSLDGKVNYAFEGASFIAGAAVQFLRDQLDLLGSAPESEALARSAVGSPEVYFVPALAGLGAPHWNPLAQGAFFGLTRGTKKEQLVRAALEGIAFQVMDLIEAMNADFSNRFAVLRVDGGACANNVLMQAQADFSGLTVDRPCNIETTAFGAAMFAGLGCGLYSDLRELRSVRETEMLFKPDVSRSKEIAEQRQGWKRAVEAVQVFAR